MKLRTFLLMLGISVMGTAMATTPATKTDHSTSKEGAAIAWVMVLDNNEIGVANLALQKSKNTQVRDYAQMLYRDHSANLNQTTELSKSLNESPVYDKSALSLKAEGKQMKAKLMPLKGDKFDNAFIKDMIMGHTAALKNLDNNLIPSINNTQLDDHLKSTRSSVQNHLTAAQAIQKSETTHS